MCSSPCRSRCVRTDNCTVKNVSTTWYDCCSGFTARSAGRDHGYGYGRVNRHPSYFTLMREGCPIGKCSIVEPDIRRIIASLHGGKYVWTMQVQAPRMLIIIASLTQWMFVIQCTLHHYGSACSAVHTTCCWTPALGRDATMQTGCNSTHVQLWLGMQL